MQISSVITTVQIKASKKDQKEVADFQGLYADQIKARVSNLKSNTKKLESLLVDPYLTKKLSALPRTLPEDIWLSGVVIDYPYNFDIKKANATMTIEGVASSLLGNKEELVLGDKFKSNLSTDPDFADLCKNSANISYNMDSSLKSKGEAFVLGTKFVVKCGNK